MHGDSIAGITDFSSLVKGLLLRLWLGLILGFNHSFGMIYFEVIICVHCIALEPNFLSILGLCGWIAGAISPFRNEAGEMAGCTECLDDSLCCNRHGRRISPCRLTILNLSGGAVLGVSTYVD